MVAKTAVVFANIADPILELRIPARSRRSRRRSRHRANRLGLTFGFSVMGAS
jgi:hypothetical protein